MLVAATTAEDARDARGDAPVRAPGALAAAALAAVLATLLARRALRPLSRLSSGARAIARTGDASQRLPSPAARDEVGDLAETLNAMLASLERAREAERRFVADASHELRTPLTALRGNAAYVARHGADPAVLADIEADAARLAALLDDLLALAREDAAAPVRGEPVDLVAVAREAAGADLAADALVEPADGAVLVLAERPALERAVGNLVRNARRHGPPDGRITIAVGRDGDRARISVADEGPGLGGEDAARAFERFWRGPEAPRRGLRPRPRDRARHGRAPWRPRRGRGRALHDRPARALRELSKHGA